MFQIIQRNKNKVPLFIFLPLSIPKSACVLLCLNKIFHLPPRLYVWRMEKSTNALFLWWFCFLSLAWHFGCCLVVLYWDVIFFFFRYFISEFHKGGLLVHFIMSFICKLRQGLLQCLRSTPSVLCGFSVSTDISMVSVIKKKKVMCSMLLLFFLYVVFNTIIKATTGHQTLQVIGKHMQMVFLIIRFLLLQYVMKCRWKRCEFQKGGYSWKELQLCCLGTAQAKRTIQSGEKL